MSSFQITITPKERAAGRFVSRVRRVIQKALAEEGKKKGVTQSDIARAIGVNRSVISREIRGHKDITLSRVAEIAWAMGRKPIFDMPEITTISGANMQTNHPVSTMRATPGVSGYPPILASTAAANNNVIPLGRIVAN
jgi:transcriptional regulator with XRE-family HTH domain